MCLEHWAPVAARPAHEAATVRVGCTCSGSAHPEATCLPDRTSVILVTMQVLAAQEATAPSMACTPNMWSTDRSYSVIIVSLLCKDSNVRQSQETHKVFVEFRTTALETAQRGCKYVEFLTKQGGRGTPSISPLKLCSLACIYRIQTNLELLWR